MPEREKALNKPEFGVIFCKMIKSIDDVVKAP